MRLKEYNPSSLDDRDYRVYEDAVRIGRDCMRWQEMRNLALAAQSPSLETILLQESNIMFHTSEYYDSNREEFER